MTEESRGWREGTYLKGAGPRLGRRCCGRGRRGRRRRHVVRRQGLRHRLQRRPHRSRHLPDTEKLYTSLARSHRSHPTRPIAAPTAPAQRLRDLNTRSNYAQLTAFSTVKIHSDRTDTESRGIIGDSLVASARTDIYFTFTYILTIVEMVNGNRHAKNY